MIKLYRPSDYSIYVKLKCGNYTNENNVSRQHSHIIPKYSKNYLLSLGWKYVKNEIETRKLHDEYYAYVSWSGRSDGHGGSKGGTIEEFRNLNK